MSKSTPSILNHFKRKQDDKEIVDVSNKRLKPVQSPKARSTSFNSDFKFQIPPPGFGLETSQNPGRAVKKNPDLDLVLFKPFLSKSCATALYKYLLASL